MLRSCSVPLCPTVKSHRSLHYLPSNHFLRMKWINVLKLNKKKVSKRFQVCSSHFAESDFLPSNSYRIFLKRSVVPSKNLPSIVSKVPPRKPPKERQHFSIEENIQPMSTEEDNRIIDPMTYQQNTEEPKAVEPDENIKKDDVSGENIKRVRDAIENLILNLEDTDESEEDLSEDDNAHFLNIESETLKLYADKCIQNEEIGSDDMHTKKAKVAKRYQYNVTQDERDTFSEILFSVLLLLSFISLVATVIAQCPSTLPNCANYPNNFFVNNLSHCRAYWYCANASSQPSSGMCAEIYNFHEAKQMCDFPANFPCKECFVDVAVQEHNRYRALHGSPNVASFSNDINQFAQQWAEYLASTDQFYHSSGSGFGENLYKSWGGSSDPKVIVANAIKLFYDEIRYYDWNNPGFSMQTGHFTQVVWKASTEIGVGVSIHPDPGYGHRSVVSINYRPHGNVIGQFEQNVPRLLASRFINSNSTESYSGEKPIKIMVL